jgi:hypothetical protein
LCCASSKLKVGFGFNHGGFSGITMGAMSTKFISEFSKCVFTLLGVQKVEGDRVALAAVFGQQVYSARIPSASSIFSAEANAILLALKFVASSGKSKFMICSDSL